ncbi:DUF3265 domain-containing protein [Vibrio parahaemolyticus]|nr:DUF3265 domain-containing protein [Vibrio parahaemolyticus]
MTKRSSGTHAAWHFWYALSFCGDSGLRKLGLCGIHPLTRRYFRNGSLRLNVRDCSLRVKVAG